MLFIFTILLTRILTLYIKYIIRYLRHEPRGRDAQRAKSHVRGTGNQVCDYSVPLNFLRPERAVRDQIQVKVEFQVFGHFCQQVYRKPETTIRLRQRPTYIHTMYI